MSNSEEPIVVDRDDPAWDLSKEWLRSRVSAMAELSGQNPGPTVKFSPAWTDVGPDHVAPLGYGAWACDVIGFNVHGVFGPQPPAVHDQNLQDRIDGAVLHELGHRRLRSVQWAVSDPVRPAVLSGGCFVLYLGVEFFTDRELLTPLIVALAVIWGLVLTLRVPVQRWLERKADDYVLDVGGVRLSNAFMDGLDSLFAGTSDGSSTVHDPAADRRARQESRARRLRPTA